MNREPTRDDAIRAIKHRMHNSSIRAMQQGKLAIRLYQSDIDSLGLGASLWVKARGIRWVRMHDGSVEVGL